MLGGGIDLSGPFVPVTLRSRHLAGAPRSFWATLSLSHVLTLRSMS